MAKKKVVKTKEPEPVPVVAPQGKHYRMSDAGRTSRPVLGFATKNPNAVVPVPEAPPLDPKPKPEDAKASD